MGQPKARQPWRLLALGQGCHRSLASEVRAQQSFRRTASVNGRANSAVPERIDRRLGWGSRKRRNRRTRALGKRLLRRECDEATWAQVWPIGPVCTRAGRAELGGNTVPPCSIGRRGSFRG